MPLYTKAGLCAAILLTCLVVIGTINEMSFLEWRYSVPARLGRDVHSMPALSLFYFKSYFLSWSFVIVLGLWGIVLVLRRKTGINDVALFAAIALLVTAAFSMFALLAFYLGNQVFLA